MPISNVNTKQTVELNKLAKQSEEIIAKKDSLEGSIFSVPSSPENKKQIDNYNRQLDSLDYEINKINDERDKEVKGTGFNYSS